MEDGQLHEFLDAVGQRYAPAIPDEVVAYYLESVGFTTDDPRIIRMVALVAQKFVLDVAHDAKLFHEHRVNGQAGNVTSDNLTLTMEDLAASLREYGVNLSKPEYFCDSASTLQTVGTPSAVPGKAIKK
ncbi:hypothetical protein H310_13230 [Aphanomyces invadans]|uniref:Transcription initiation factor TFIID subunit 10 n=1 Tax=Aphanomyces invadans TaxID=157072 RepID=A0A024TEY2_9STRA|nr:hypothetical protein H310_13230 [Aphanomyces invadans]ETV92569.1 hypothetical protein H310_13230 [Aphanomyces invadans]|eukprot:XP_008878876.1 hypothetical protein H310_13230 [Aphanomyces invadans]